MRRLFLDLDGVMADFEGAFPLFFGTNHRHLTYEAMWEAIYEHGTFFADLPLMDGAKAFFASIEHLDPIILTACPAERYAEVAIQKRAWVRQHLSDEVLILPVQGSASKALFMHAPGDILIDDFSKNTLAWQCAGGRAIRHTCFAATSRELAAIAAGFAPRATAEVLA